MSRVLTSFSIAEAVYARGAVVEGLKRYREALEETKRKHPGCEDVYVVAIQGLEGALKVLDEACVVAGVRSVAEE